MVSHPGFLILQKDASFNCGRTLGPQYDASAQISNEAKPQNTRIAHDEKV